jgi:hypothetical protein
MDHKFLFRFSDSLPYTQQARMCMSMSMIPRYTASGYECADLCAWTFSSATFPAGGGLANVRWNCKAAAIKQGCTSRYYLIQASCPALLSLPKPENCWCMTV